MTNFSNEIDVLTQPFPYLKLNPSASFNPAVTYDNSRGIPSYVFGNNWKLESTNYFNFIYFLVADKFNLYFFKFKGYFKLGNSINYT